MRIIACAGLSLLLVSALSQAQTAGSAGTPVQPGAAPVAAACETVQSDRLIAGGPPKQDHAVELIRCGQEFRLKLIRSSGSGPRETLAEISLGPAAKGAKIELAGGACLLAGKPVMANLAIHGAWGKRKEIRAGAGLLGAWLPDAATGTIRAVSAQEKLVCQADSP